MKKVFEIINKNLESSFLFGKIFHHEVKEYPPIITISREKGSGGRPLAYLVAKELGTPWKVFHKNIVEEIAREVDLEQELIEEIDENQIPVMEQIIGGILGKHYLALSSYYKHLVQILTAIGQRGHAIIIGRGANFLFPRALKIRVIGEMEERIKGVMKYERVSRRDAIALIEESDKKRITFTKSLFQHDPRKAHHYDIIIRIGENMSLEDATILIVDAAKRRFKL